MPSPKSEAELSPEWRAWIVENLLRGADNEEIVKALDAEGVPRSLTALLPHTARTSRVSRCDARNSPRTSVEDGIGFYRRHSIRNCPTKVSTGRTLYPVRHSTEITIVRIDRFTCPALQSTGLLTLAGRLIIYAITSVT